MSKGIDGFELFRNKKDHDSICSLFNNLLALERKDAKIIIDSELSDEEDLSGLEFEIREIRELLDEGLND